MKLSILLMILVFFSSCEGYIRLSGKIVAENNKEIEGAKIELLDVPPIDHYDPVTNTYKDSIFVSDKNGLFTVHSKMIGMLFGIPKYKIRISKDGFQTSEIRITKQTSKDIRSVKDSVLTIQLKKLTEG